jgi:acyl-CoA reductase-like NAD-dependent aldehyde dehydrogenase
MEDEQFVAAGDQLLERHVDAAADFVFDEVCGEVFEAVDDDVGDAADVVDEFAEQLR